MEVLKYPAAIIKASGLSESSLYLDFVADNFPVQLVRMTEEEFTAYNGGTDDYKKSRIRDMVELGLEAYVPSVMTEGSQYENFITNIATPYGLSVRTFPAEWGGVYAFYLSRVGNRERVLLGIGTLTQSTSSPTSWTNVLYRDPWMSGVTMAVNQPFNPEYFQVASGNRFGYGVVGPITGTNTGVILTVQVVSGDVVTRYVKVGFGLRFNDNSDYFISNQNASAAILFGETSDAPVDPPEPGPEPQPDDPFAGGGTSGPGGGGGAFDDSSDTITDSALPTLSVANTGLTRIYNPSLSQVQALASYLWTDPSLVQTLINHIKQYFEDPMEAFIGFNLVPVPVPNDTGETFKVMFLDTGVTMNRATQQFVDVDCGTVNLTEYYGSALDYSPYTSLDIFLPYIGTQPLDIDECMGSTLQVKYRVDIVSGGCVAKVFVNGSCMYQYSGHCAVNIPLTSADFSSYVSAIIGAAAVAAEVVAGAGITAAATAPEAEAVTSELAAQSTELSTEFAHIPIEHPVPAEGASMSHLAPVTAANTVAAVANSKPHISHSGNFSGTTGYLGVRRPYIIVKRPRMCNPEEYGKFNGYPSMLTLSLGSVSGFTQVQQVQLTGMSGTINEQDELLSLLKSGVIL